MNLHGKVVIVTCGASGLCEGTARRYADLDAKVAFFDMDDARGTAVQ